MKGEKWVERGESYLKVVSQLSRGNSYEQHVHSLCFDGQCIL
jgi:hypothetical protein